MPQKQVFCETMKNYNKAIRKRLHENPFTITPSTAGPFLNTFKLNNIKKTKQNPSK